MRHRLRPIVFRLALALALAAIGQATVFAQAPDHRGEIPLDQPVYKGVRASAPIPPEQHVLNEGGSDRAGLCVIASILANGQYQGVPGFDARGYDERTGRQVPGKGTLLWRTAKSRPGGYAPQKLERLVSEVLPHEKWAEYVGRDTTVLDTLSRKGYPIGATMNTGALYQYAPIHHMVSLIEYREDGLACVVDNNEPGVYRWMPATEFARRWIDGGVGWAWIWTRLPPTVVAAGLGGSVLVLASAVLLLGSRRRRTVVAFGAVLIGFGLMPAPSAQAQYWTVPYTPQWYFVNPPAPQAPQKSWHDVIINGQATKVWGWLDQQGYVRYHEHEQPARPAPKPAPPAPKPSRPTPGVVSEAGVKNYGVNLDDLRQPSIEGLRTNDAEFRPEVSPAQTLGHRQVPEFESIPTRFGKGDTALLCALILGIGLLVALFSRRSRP